MDKDKIINKLEPMVGNQFLIAGKAERITGYKFEQSSIKLITDRRVRVFDGTQLEDFLRRECMEIGTELDEMGDEFDEMVAPSRAHEVSMPMASQQVYVPSFNNNHFAELRLVLMNNIERVQGDKEYLPQAVAVRDNVQSVIDLTKNEIDFMKTINRIKR